MISIKIKLKARNRNYIIKRIWSGVAYPVLCIFLFSCTLKKSDGEKSYFEEEIKTEVSADQTARLKNVSDSILTNMTLEEKAGQCLLPSIYARNDIFTIDIYKRYIEDYHIGGVVLLQGNIEAAKDLVEEGMVSKVPLFIAIDAEWGLGMRLEDARTYPRNGNLDKNLEDTSLFDYGNEIAMECRGIGINMVLGPVVDITGRRGGVIGSRSFGKDPEMVSEYGIAYAKGLESGGVISVAKHFPGHGSTEIDSHKGIAKITRNITALDTVDLKPFRKYIESGLSGIMAGHIQSLALDPEGRAATVSIDMLTRLLREEMGFKGLILTDAFDMGGAQGFTATEALNAGADLILCPRNIKEDYNNILESVKNGTLPVSVLDDRCSRILFYKALFLGL